MKRLALPFQLGSLTLRNRVLYAPLAGCSDLPFRKMSAKYQPGLMFCEMVKMEPLVRKDAKTRRYLDVSPEMYPIGAQICGSNASIAGESAKIIEDLGFHVVDFNCGCPVDKVTKDGSGSAMLKTPELIGEILANMVAAVKIPVTVKIRAGWDEDQINAPLVVKIAEQAGAQSICVHGRTREQAYRGPANWDYIKACKDAATTIKVVGNGDVLDGESALRMLDHTGCDAVLVARGTMGSPWAVEDILRHEEGLPPILRTLEDQRQALYEHFNYMLEYYPEHRVCMEMRRVGCWYFKNAGGVRKFRDLFNQTTDVAVMRDMILHFPFGQPSAADQIDAAE